MDSLSLSFYFLSSETTSRRVASEPQQRHTPLPLEPQRFDVMATSRGVAYGTYGTTESWAQVRSLTSAQFAGPEMPSFDMGKACKGWDAPKQSAGRPPRPTSLVGSKQQRKHRATLSEYGPALTTPRLPLVMVVRTIPLWSYGGVQACERLGLGSVWAGFRIGSGFKAWFGLVLVGLRIG